MSLWRVWLYILVSFRFWENVPEESRSTWHLMLIFFCLFCLFPARVLQDRKAQKHFFAERGDGRRVSSTNRFVPSPLKLISTFSFSNRQPCFCGCSLPSHVSTDVFLTGRPNRYRTAGRTQQHHVTRPRKTAGETCEGKKLWKNTLVKRNDVCPGSVSAHEKASLTLHSGSWLGFFSGNSQLMWLETRLQLS